MISNYIITILISEWLVETNQNEKFEQLPPPELDDIFSRFYASLTPCKGDKTYSKSTYTNVRAAINRHLRLPPHNRQINVMKDREFQRSNQVIRIGLPEKSSRFKIKSCSLATFSIIIFFS